MSKHKTDETNLNMPNKELSDSLKKAISHILQESLSSDTYRTDKGYMQWGLIERDIHNVINKLVSGSSTLVPSTPLFHQNNSEWVETAAKLLRILLRDRKMGCLCIKCLEEEINERSK